MWSNVEEFYNIMQYNADFFWPPIEMWNCEQKRIRTWCGSPASTTRPQSRHLWVLFIYLKITLIFFDLLIGQVMCSSHTVCSSMRHMPSAGGEVTLATLIQALLLGYCTWFQHTPISSLLPWSLSQCWMAVSTVVEKS